MNNILDIVSLVLKDREIQLDRPDGSGKLPIWLTIMSTDDERLKQHTRRIQDKQAHKAQRNKFFSAEEKERFLVELLARTVTGWRWEVQYNGEIPEFSYEKVYEVLSDSRIPWFLAQLTEAVGDTERFF